MGNDSATALHAFMMRLLCRCGPVEAAAVARGRTYLVVACIRAFSLKSNTVV